uniref:DUF4371 domain-containing protein n=1 Tax=Echeneis naucrates TaxID=173247 RepID=A0A665TNP5_ECHNA
MLLSVFHAVFGKNPKHDALVSSGSRNWKKALSVLSKHDMAQSHKDSVVAWKGYQATSQQGDVVQMMMPSNAHERTDYLKRIVAVTSMLGAQGLPFRGNDESVESTNRGNFLACMGLLMKFDPFPQNHNPPSNATYTSLVSENEMIECYAQEVTSVIVSEITRSKMYSIMVDEGRDGRSEQLAVCVQLMSFDAHSIADKLQQQLQINGLVDVKHVAQTYYGAAVMSGPTGGVQARFRRLHPEAIYIHCYAHELNLVLCHTCRAVSEAVELFHLLECVYYFFTTSLVNHHKFKDAQSKLGLAAVELVQLSNTGWACQLQSINGVLETLPAIFECRSLSVLSTIYTLLMFQTLLSVTEGLHKLLQKETLDLEKALKMLCVTLSRVNAQMHLPQKCTRVPRLCASYTAFLNHMLRKGRNREKLKISVCWAHNSNLITEEVLVARNFLACKADAGYPPQDMLAVHNLLSTDMFPCLKEVLQGPLTVPVSSCSCERSFNALPRLHTLLHQTMGQRRLQNFAVMAIENGILSQLSHNKGMDRFTKLFINLFKETQQIPR